MWQSCDEQAVLEEVMRGNVNAFRGIVRAHSLAIRSYLCSQLYDLDQADDLTQEIFIAAFQSLHKFRRGEDFGKWLRGIARLKLQMYFRTSSRRQGALARFREEVAGIIEVDLEQAASADRSPDIETLLRCVGRLPERLRQVVHAGLDGVKPAMLAESMSISVGAVYNLHYRANQLLRRCMREELHHER
jgi:RNA polymerase sigma-70 factor, ECF subfamily